MSTTPPPIPYCSHRLRLAYSGMHPGRIHTLVKASDPVGVVRMIEAGRIKAKPAAREAVGIPPGRRITELASSGISVTLLGTDSYPPWLAGSSVREGSFSDIAGGGGGWIEKGHPLRAQPCQGCGRGYGTARRGGG